MSGQHLWFYELKDGYVYTLASGKEELGCKGFLRCTACKMVKDLKEHD